MPDNERMHTGIGSRPVPDPTLLTTQQLQLAISALKDLVFTRLDAMDKALVLFHEDITRVPTDVDKQVGHLKELVTETFKLHAAQFESIGVKFQEGDARTVQAKVDARETLKATLEAMEKAVSAQNTSSALSISKSEMATSKAIEQLQALIQTAITTLDGKIGDVKERLTTIESKTLGQTTAHTTQQASVGTWVGVIGAAVGVVAVAIAYTAQRPPAPTPVIFEQLPSNTSAVRSAQ